MDGLLRHDVQDADTVSYTHLDVYKRQVEHMAFVDVGRAFVQMQRPVQHMNMVAEFSLELLLSLIHI